MKWLAKLFIMIFGRKPAKEVNFDLLVIGAGRGGTSLLAGLLDAHPLLKMGFEYGAEDYFVNPSTPLQNVSLARRLQLFHAHCAFRAGKTTQIWGNKLTSEQVFLLQNSGESDWLKTFKTEIVKQKKIIFILRDGRTCIASKMARGKHSLDTATSFWKNSVILWQTIKSWQNPMLTVKFEDLVTSPESELIKICAFLDIPFLPEMMAGTANPKLLKDYQRNTFDKTVLEISPEAREWTPKLQPELTAAGYISKEN